MKLLFSFLLMINSSSYVYAAFDVGSITTIRCERLKEPREKVEAALRVISEKLEECNNNNLDCTHYKWPSFVKDQNGESVVSQMAEINLWERKRTFIIALDCDFCKTEHPNEECGITEFSN